MFSPQLEPNPNRVKRVEHLESTNELAFTSYGVRIRVRFSNSQMREQVIECLPPEKEFASLEFVDRTYALTADDLSWERKRRYALDVDSNRLIETSDTEAIFDLFESNLKLFVAENAPNYVFVHAGAVGWRGQAILIPGRSFSGKTTLVAELIRAGATYYSDEYAVISSTGRVQPFAQPLAIRERGGWQQQKQAVETFGGTTGTESLPVGLVVLSQYKKGMRWQPQILSPGAGVLALLSNTVAARKQPARVLAALQKAAQTAVFVQSARGEAKACAKYILKKLNSQFDF